MDSPTTSEIDPATAEIVANCQKLLESALYLDDIDGVSAVTDKLVRNLATVDDYEEYGTICAGICYHMQLLCGKAPQRMDHLLRLYYRVADRTIHRERRVFDEMLDESSESELMDTLADNCSDFANARNVHYGEWIGHSLLHPLPPGKTNPEDDSKLIFSQEEVDTDFERVKYAIRYQAAKKSEDVVEGAILGRHAALMASGECKSEGTWWGFVDDLGIEKQLAKIMKPGDPSWSTSDSIALLLRIRGMAKSLFSKPGVSSDELQQKKARWITLLKNWLWDEKFNVGNDRLVKHHVLVSRYAGLSKIRWLIITQLTLENLLNGPFDESSEELFTGESWVF